MPFIIEQRRSVGVRRDRTERNSAIPRPLKHLVFQRDERTTISHASKPSTDPVPITPARGFQARHRSTLKASATRVASHPPNPPPKVTLREQDPEIPVLELMPFGKQPFVNFGDVLIGQTQLKYVALRNLQNFQQQLFVKTFPKLNKGFNIDATEFILAPNTEIFVALGWTPNMVGSCRETISLQDDKNMPRRIVMIGNAVRPKPNPVTARTVKCPPRFTTRLTQPRMSPNKLDRRLCQDKTKVIFSPKFSKGPMVARDGPIQKPLQRLIYASRRRQSAQFVKNVLAHKAALVLQKCWRARQARRELVQLKARRNAALILQAHLRGWLDRRRCAQMKGAILGLQTHWRGKVARQQLKQLKAQKRAVVLLQSRWRSILARRELERLRSRQNAALLLQKYWRGLRARRELAYLKIIHHSAIVIQAHWRGLVARKRYAAILRSTLNIQTRWRMIIAGRELTRLRVRRNAALILQAHWRGLTSRKRFVEMKRAALKIQSRWRGSLARRELATLKVRHDAARTLQAHWKARILRRRYFEMKRSAIKIQTHWRGKRARQELSRLRALRESTIMMQSHCRGFLVRARLNRSIQALMRIQMRSVERSVKKVR